MGAKNGTEMLLYVNVSSNPTAIAGLTSNAFNVKGETIDVTTKDSNGWRELLAGTNSFSFSADGVFDDAATFGYNDLLDAMKLKQPLMVRISTEESGEYYQEGYVIITSLDKTAPLEDKVTFSATFEGTGEPSHSTV
jgi:TP901-1 family phage major tail protein